MTTYQLRLCKILARFFTRVKMIGRMAVKMAMRKGCGELGRMSCVMDW